MRKLLQFIYLFIIISSLATGCKDDEYFTTSPSCLLTASADTIEFDTVFCNVPSSTRSFWLYNRSGDALRITSARLERGNQTGFRVNVDGTYLDNELGSTANDFEVRKGDSIRVFVEFTSKQTPQQDFNLTEDDLIFRLQSGVEQKIRLRACAWDADFIDSLIVATDMRLSNKKPLIIYKGIRVDSGATLTIGAPARLFFHDGAGIDVYGTLKIFGKAGDDNTEPIDVELRGDRLDHMFDYLPYDRVAGQWRGIHIFPSSTGNMISYADIHSACDGIVIDSAFCDSKVSRLDLTNSTIHNCKGYGIIAHNAKIGMTNVQITNTLNDCLALYGGIHSITYCTLGQFYPLDYNCGAALRFSNTYEGQPRPLTKLSVLNTLVTGRANDVVYGEQSEDSTLLYNMMFSHCILKTDTVEENLKPLFENVVFECKDDTVHSSQHFKYVDEYNQMYDFRLDSISTAIGKARPVGFKTDRLGHQRKEKPSIGCFEY